MAWMLNWAARDAARLAAAAASRAARLAANAASSPEAAAAASRAARSASRAARSAASRAAIIPRTRSRANRPRRPDGYPVPGLDVTAEDIASDETIWALYEHWCKAYNKERDRDEMTRRFPLFKQSAMDIHKYEHLGHRLGSCADGLEKGIEHERAQLAARADEIGSDEYKILKKAIDMWERDYKKLGVPIC